MKLLKKQKIVTIVGARPQFIKAVLVSNELKNACVNEVVINTGQHYDYNMSEIFFRQLKKEKPEYNLNIRSGSHGQQIGNMLVSIEKVLLREKPRLVIVYGDTNSTLAGALATAKLNIPLAHVEAGMRSFDKTMPEEINRVLTDYISSLLFCPTTSAVKNLKRENINGKIVKSGDIMIELANNFINKIDEKKILSDLKINKKEYCLLTIHRASNTDNRKCLKNILRSLEVMRTLIVFPIHPRTKKMIKKFKLKRYIPQNIKIIAPLSYMDNLAVEKNAKFIITDSGGVQKEAFFFKRPCVTLRRNTEWVETLNYGWNKLVDPANILQLRNYLSNIKIPNKYINHYKYNKKPSETIVNLILSHLRQAI